MVPSDWDIGHCLGNRKQFLENACFWFEVLLHIRLMLGAGGGTDCCDLR